MPYFNRTESIALIACCLTVLSVVPSHVHAEETESTADVPAVSRQVLLQGLADRLRNGYQRANVFLQNAGIEKAPLNLRGLEEGEVLIFKIRIPGNVELEETVISEIYRDDLYLSLRDFITAVNFPIEYDVNTGNFSGWFIRESREFRVDKELGVVFANGVEYRLGDNVLDRGEDLYFPVSSYESWFGLELEPSVGEQIVRLDAEPPLPVMERLNRRKFKARKSFREPPKLPRGEDDYKLIGIPQVDVNTRSAYRSPANGDVVRSQDVNIRTSGEFAYGALNTNIAINNTDQLRSARVTYLQESALPELLGPLNARRLEVGDVQPTRLPITGGAPPETGVRITNLDPLVRQTLPSTQISGYIFPGWDVELYRENSLLSFVETDDNGFYSFDNVRLFSDRNFFRVVAYGPQGEVREENVSVPYDPNREANDSSIYDVSISRQNTQFYNKFESADPDKGSPHFVGFFETPLTDATALRLGARYREENEQQKAYATAGVSTSYAGALVNATAATDEDGELGAEFVVTRQFGPHNFRADLDLATDNYNPGQSNSIVEVLSNRYAVEGPLPFQIGERPRYSTSVNYSETSDGETVLGGNANFNTTYKRLGFNQSFIVSDSTLDEDGVQADSNTSITGTLGRDTYRLRANYEISPESELDSLFASWRRRISPELESQLEVGRTLDADLSSISGQLNWRPDYATISPRFAYDSDGNAEATLTTRFGITRNPDPGEFVFSRDFVTSTGTINAFVFLDKNGNMTYDGDDEPIPDARVSTPQNAGGADTNESGVAFISRLRPNVITDVYVEVGTLSDPFWIPAGEGVSIMPRTGTNVRVDLPVHNSGEIDGTIYAKSADGSTRPLRGVSLKLYSEDGEVEQSSASASDGFYLFSLVPPGRYALSVADDVLPQGISRPRPQFIEIGYDGTTIFGNDVILETGREDIPNAILADLDDYKAQHPHIDFSQNNFEIALNLGAYKSRLLTSFMWYRLNTRYADIVRGTTLYVPPSQSYALPQTGEHVLRVGLQSENIDDAYNRCRALAARDLYCKVEIYPTAKKQKLAAVAE